MRRRRCSKNIDGETRQDSGVLKGIYRSLRKFRSYVSRSALSTHSISPSTHLISPPTHSTSSPSYQSVLLEKHFKPGVEVLCQTEKEWITKAKKSPPSYTAQK